MIQVAKSIVILPTDFRNYPVVWTMIVISLILGWIKFSTIDTKSWNWQRKFVEMWNDFVNFFIAGLVGYYFIVVRWPRLFVGDTLNTSDIFLLIVFLLGFFGHLCVLSNNITEGIKAIIDRYFKG